MNDENTWWSTPWGGYAWGKELGTRTVYFNGRYYCVTSALAKGVVRRVTDVSYERPHGYTPAPSPERYMPTMTIGELRAVVAGLDDSVQFAVMDTVNNCALFLNDISVDGDGVVVIEVDGAFS